MAWTYRWRAWLWWDLAAKLAERGFQPDDAHRLLDSMFTARASTILRSLSRTFPPARNISLSGSLILSLTLTSV